MNYRDQYFRKLLSFWSLGMLLLAFTASSLAAATDQIGYEDLKSDRNGMPGERSLSKEIDVAPDLKLTARIHVTAKGNGFLEIANLSLKVFDEHDDGSFYEGGLLNIEFADLDGDGKKELIISGIVCSTDNKAERVLSRQAVAYIYKLQANKSFRQIYANTKFRLE